MRTWSMWRSRRSPTVSITSSAAPVPRKPANSVRRPRHARRVIEIARSKMTLPAVAPPLPPSVSWNRHVAPSVAFDWLKAGWRDLTIIPSVSLSYGVLVFAVSVVLVGGLFAFGWDYILFPAFAGFMVVGPVLAIGLYEKSRRIAAHERVSLLQMIL